LSINFVWRKRLFMGMDNNRTDRFGRTLALAGPASPAPGFVHFRTIYAIMLHSLNGQIRTEFLAYHAILGRVPRQTAGAIHPGRADGQGPFSFQRKTANGARRTDACANPAPFIAVAPTEIQAGR
jgi:hypothetical protein